MTPRLVLDARDIAERLGMSVRSVRDMDALRPYWFRLPNKRRPVVHVDDLEAVIRQSKEAGRVYA